MVFKSYKSQAAAEILRKETNVHFLNPSTRKIDLKMFTKHLHEKDEHADLELKANMYDYSSYSDNQFITAFYSSSDADNEISSSDEKPIKSTITKRRKKTSHSR